MERLTLPKVAQIDKCPMQIFINNLDILAKLLILANVILGKSNPLKQTVVHVLVYSESISNESCPNFTAYFHWNALFERIFKST